MGRNASYRVSRRRNRTPKPKLKVHGVDGDFIQLESRLHQDFRVYDHDAYARGILYEEDETSYVILVPHEDIQEIMKTCEHEAIHYALRNELNSIDVDETYRIPLEKEHKMMRFFMLSHEAIHEKDPPPLEGVPLYETEE